MRCDLTDEEDAALARLLSDIIHDDRYPLSPRIRRLKRILGKIWPEPPPAPPPPIATGKSMALESRGNLPSKKLARNFRFWKIPDATLHSPSEGFDEGPD